MRYSADPPIPPSPPFQRGISGGTRKVPFFKGDLGASKSLAEQRKMLYAFVTLSETMLKISIAAINEGARFLTGDPQSGKAGGKAGL
ncbi:MAG: hypothetical protein D6680_17815 [Cyanobacteria bacterium J007]|jgi:hypothetical protein|nr:MAG: hypothetical protein D6680_17815 [Cyanobacteria bacterium J007]